MKQVKYSAGPTKLPKKLRKGAAKAYGKKVARGRCWEPYLDINEIRWRRV